MLGPTQAAFYLTAKCNHDCSYCVARRHHGTRPKDMTAAVAGKVLDLFPSIRSVGAGGGESLLCPDIWEIVELCKSRGKGVVLSTNGTLIKPEHPLEGLRVNISARAATRAAYRAVSGRDTFDEMRRGVEIALGQGAVVGVSFVVEQNSAGRLFEWAKFAKSLGVNIVSFMSVLPDGRGGFTSRAILPATMPEIDKQKKKVDKLGLSVRQWPSPIFPGSKGKGCTMAKRHIAVDGDGNVALCCRGPGPRPEMGNISEGSRVWCTGAMERRRKQVYDPERRPKKCLLCKANWNDRVY